MKKSSVEGPQKSESRHITELLEHALQEARSLFKRAEILLQLGEMEPSPELAGVLGEFHNSLDYIESIQKSLFSNERNEDFEEVHSILEEFKKKIAYVRGFLPESARSVH